MGAREIEKILLHDKVCDIEAYPDPGGVRIMLDFESIRMAVVLSPANARQLADQLNRASRRKVTDAQPDRH